ncbi:hypothetical protein, partial [Dysosmobacter sp. HCP28S3_G4]|uniref:hypothetical protein n=1 Tax=Dysosmobacter sp. HCP28S3_G4 TaxID=3438938 RepID=UPI003F8C6D1B
MKQITKRVMSVALTLIMLLSILPTTALAANLPKGWTDIKPTGSVVTVYGTTTTYGQEGTAIKSGPTYRNKWYKQISPEKNTNNQSYTIPKENELFEIAEGWKLAYVSVAANSSGKKQPGNSILLSSSGASLVYYFEKIPAPATKDVTVVFYENVATNEVSRTTIKVDADATYVNTGAMTLPEGYEFAGETGDLPIRDGYVYVSVKKTAPATKDVTVVFYENVATNEVSRTTIKVDADATYVNTG